MIKKLWIAANGLLGVICLYLIFSSPVPALEMETEKKDPSAAKAKTVKSSRNDSAGNGVPVELPDADTACEKIIAADLFSQVRSPLANVRGGRGELMLTGTFKIGNLEGAIIQMKANQRQYNPFLAQAMRAQGAPPGAPGGNRGGRNGMRGGFPGGPGGPDGMPGAPGQPGAETIGLTKQYVRLGETLSNGYTLCEVSRTRAVLMRGNDKIELELQDPSKNRASATPAPKQNPWQQMQQAQMMMQGQMVRTMMMMQQNMQNGGPPPGRGGNRGGGRR